jgi:soluble cytochrome b562
VGRQAVAAALAALALAGCEFGSGDGSAEFIKEADTICQRYEQQIALIPQPRTLLRDFAVYMRRTVPIARQQNQELRRLDPPEQDEEDFRRMLDLLDQQLDIAAQAGELAYRGNEEAARAALQESLAPAGEASRLAEEIGFFSCARATG